ncbi:hypothetical protein RhiJN_18838 [Ceratobasidium sp. AG-Ba]|nr:hypothetical protein RhiJN_18838 [Ceratobasidium sp. AG-Ba]
MSTVAVRKPSHSRNHSAHAPAFKKRAQNASNVEKWDVVMWNDEVHSSSTVPSPQDHRQSPLSSRSASSDNIPRSFISVGTNSAPSGPLPPGNTTPSFAFTASAFGFGTSSTKPKPIPRRTPPCSPTAESPQIRLDALASLHRSVQEHDASFLARMRELEERCHLLPDSLAVLRSEDLSHTTRGRKRGCASWDEDGDVEMSSWNERRQRHFDARSCSRLSFGHSEPSAEESHDLKECSSSEDEYVLPDQEGEDSHSEDEEDDDLDIVIVEGDSVPSLFNSGSTPHLFPLRFLRFLPALMADRPIYVIASHCRACSEQRISTSYRWQWLAAQAASSIGARPPTPATLMISAAQLPRLAHSGHKWLPHRLSSAR